MTTTIPSPPLGYTIIHEALWKNYIDRFCLYDCDPRQLSTMLSAKTDAKLDTIGIERNPDHMNAGGNVLFIRGKLLKTVLAKIADKPDKKSSIERPMNSIGVQHMAVAASDGRSAVEIGWPEAGERYQATSRKAAALEAEREIIYQDGADVHELERLTMDGELSLFPDVTKIVDSGLASIKLVGNFDPELLKRACEVALSAGSKQITIFSGALKTEGVADIDLIGFQFDTVPDDDQLDLFGFAGAVPVRGVIVGRTRDSKDDDEVCGYVVGTDIVEGVES